MQAPIIAQDDKEDKDITDSLKTHPDRADQINKYLIENVIYEGLEAD